MKLEPRTSLNFMMVGTATDNVVLIRRYGFEHILDCLAKKNPAKEEQEIIDNCLNKARELLEKGFIKDDDNI